jgi:hypothetical protein
MFPAKKPILRSVESTVGHSTLPDRPGTTGIGSLPHHNIDAALAFSFQNRIPFLPQIPIRNPWEYMIAQALEGMPGLSVDKEGSSLLDLAVWTGRSHAFNERLLAAFSNSAHFEAFAPFEPSSAASSSWQPYLWELAERNIRLAKIQIAGPLTCQWVLRLKDGTPADRYPEVGEQVYRLVLARALAMSRRLLAEGVQPLLYLDEPGLYGFSSSNPRQVLGLQQLKLLVQALSKEGVIVGLHCCSNTDWGQILGLGLNVVSLDSELSLGPVLEHRSAVEAFLDRGGRFSLGIVPTSQSGRVTELNGAQLVRKVEKTLNEAWPEKPSLPAKILREAIFTPACGLALQSPTDAESTLATLLEIETFCEQKLT